MTSETTTTTTRKSSNGSDPSRPVQAAVAEVRGAIENVSKSVPDVARASRKSFDDMFKAIETGSDERVSAGVTLSLGLAILFNRALWLKNVLRSAVFMPVVMPAVVMAVVCETVAKIVQRLKY